MLGSERQLQILSYLQQHESIRVQDIVKNFYVSDATARRDLTALEKSGAIKRVFGGAMLVQRSDKQIPLFVREKEDENEKSRLCAKAATFIRDGDILFIDGSSTAQFLLPYLSAFKDLVVITNGLKIAEKLGEMHIKVYCTGGLLIENSSTLTGADAEKFVDGFNADLCFLSCKGLSNEGKLTDTSYMETQLRKHFLENARKRVVLMTANKLGKKYLHTLCESKDVDFIITDAPLPFPLPTRTTKAK